MVRFLLQRLFSMFANGWPGKGLVALRFALASYVAHECFARFNESTSFARDLPTHLAGIAGLFVLIGLWTPVTSLLVVFLEVWNAIAQPGDKWAAALAAAIALSLALLGPGAHSVDARIYGRKRIIVSTS
jgi:putative oxidoreductase